MRRNSADYFTYSVGMAAFVSTVLASTEDVWTQIFRQGGAQYQLPKLVLFRGTTAR